jgi:hypothetical protein
MGRTLPVLLKGACPELHSYCENRVPFSVSRHPRYPDMRYNFARVHRTLRLTPAMGPDSPTMSGHRSNRRAPPTIPSTWLRARAERLRQHAEVFQERSRMSSRRRALFEDGTFVRPKGGVMEDEWMKVISGDRLVKYTYLDLPQGTAFLTAQIAGHDVVYSVFVRQAEHPFNREGVERHFDYECPRVSH